MTEYYPGNPQAISVAMTGASGAQYGFRLVQCLLEAGEQVYLMISSAAKVVVATEMQESLPGQPQALQAALSERYQSQPGQLSVFGREQWLAPVASGSAAPRAMVVCPASMGTVSALATGASNNLIERAADVMLKERRQLILVPRETPYSTIMLENMHKLSSHGVVILPATPGFYHQPQQISDLIDFVVARILDQLVVSHQLSRRWGVGYKPEVADD